MFNSEFWIEEAFCVIALVVALAFVVKMLKDIVSDNDKDDDFHFGGGC